MAPDNRPGWGLWALYPAPCQGSRDNQGPTSPSQPQIRAGLGLGVLGGGLPPGAVRRAVLLSPHRHPWASRSPVFPGTRWAEAGRFLTWAHLLLPWPLPVAPLACSGLCGSSHARSTQRHA